jgi:CspA family cold shock protein
MRAEPKKPAFQTSMTAAGLFPRFNQPEAEMAVGTVKWFNSTKGYGFIQPEDGGKDVFVHISAVERSDLNALAEGQRVGYELEKDRRTGKESAVNLKSA